MRPARGARRGPPRAGRALNTAVHLHLLAALPASGAEALLEWPLQPLRIWSGLFPRAPQPRFGRVAVPEAPGWGISPDLSELHRLTVR